MSRVRKGVITARTMRDTLLRTEIMMANEEHNKRGTNPRDLIARIILIMGIIRGEARMATKTGVLTTKTGDPTATKTEIPMEIGAGTGIVRGTLMEPREAPTGIRIEAPTGIRIEAPTGIRIEAPTGIRIGAPTEKEMVARENAALEWVNGFSHRKEARAEDTATGVGEINLNILAVDRKVAPEVPKRSLRRKNHSNKLSIRRTPILTRRSD